MSSLLPPAFLFASGILILLLRLASFPKKRLLYLVLILLFLPIAFLSASFSPLSLMALEKTEKIFLSLLLGTALLWHLGTFSYSLKNIPALYEFYAFVFFAVGGMALFLPSRDFLLSYLSLEIFSFSLYVLCGFGKTKEATEGALKYFFIGGIASSFFLLGLALYFGATGTTQFVLHQPTRLFQAGLMLMLGVFFFKFSLFPFFVWVPDVYQGAPFPVTALMATTVKITLFPVIMRLLAPFLGSFPYLLPLVFFIVLFTQFAGNLAALAQEEIKRMLAYSSIAQAGYLGLAFLTGKDFGFGAFYLLAYTLMTLGSFLFFQEMAQEDDLVYLEKIKGFGKTAPLLWGIATLFMLSLIGIPFTGGFAGKVFLFGNTLASGYFTLTLLSLLNSVLSAGYYLKVPIAAFFQEGQPTKLKISRLPFLALSFCALGTLFLGLLPSFALYLLSP